MKVRVSRLLKLAGNLGFDKPTAEEIVQSTVSSETPLKGDDYLDASVWARCYSDLVGFRVYTLGSKDRGYIPNAYAQLIEKMSLTDPESLISMVLN